MANSLAVDIVAKTDGLTAGLTKAQAQVQAFTQSVNKSADAQAVQASEQAIATSAQNTAQAWVTSRRAMMDAETRATALLKAGRKADVSSLSDALTEMEQRRDAFLASTQAYYGSLSSTQAAAFAAQEAAANKEIEAEYQRLAGRLEDATAVDADTEALGVNTVALTFNATAMREAGFAASELATARYGRLETSLLSVANRTGLMRAAFSPLGLAIGGAAAALGTFAVATIEGERESSAFNRAILSTGDAAEVTEGQFNAMAEAIAKGDITIGTARGALLSLTQSGKFTGETLGQAAQGAVDFASITGESMKEATAAVESLATKPTEAIAKLNEQYHFLTAAQFEHIQKLQQEGDETGAAQAAVEAFASAMHQRAQQSVRDEGLIVKGWEHVKSAVTDAWEQVKGLGRDQTATEQITALQERIANLNVSSQGGIFSGIYTAERNRLQAQLQVLQAQERQNEAAAQAKAKADQVNEAGIAAEQTYQRQLDTLKSHNLVLEKTLALRKEIEQIHAANPSSPLVKGDIFDTSGALTQGNAAYDKLIAGIQQKFDAHPIKIRIKEESAADAVTGLNQSMEWLRQYASQQQEIEDSHSSATQQVMRLELDTKKQTLDAEVAAGQMSAAKAIQIEQGLTSQLYAQDIERLQNELSTLDQRSVEYARVSDQIKIIKAQEVAELAALDHQYVTQSKRYVQQQASQWRGVVSEIEGSESGMVSDLLSKRKSLSQSLIQVSGNLVEKEIADDVRAFTTRILLANSFQAQSKALEQGGYLYHLLFETHKTATTVAQQAAQTSATVAGNAARTAAVTSAAAAQKGVAAATGGQMVLADAAKAFSGTYAAVAQIPYVGWIAAPLAASAAYAAVAAYQGLASLDTGTNYVPRDMVANIHEGEAVVPKEYNPAAGGSGGLGSGGSGAGYSEEHNYNGDVNISAFNSRDVARMFKSGGYRSAMAQGLMRAYRRGLR